MIATAQFAPSLLSADFLNIQRDVALLADSEVAPEWLHIDVMDGHFVPNLTIGPAFVRALRKSFPALPLDVHLMISNPEAQINWYLDAGADLLTIHLEATANTLPCNPANAATLSQNPSINKPTPHDSSAIGAPKHDSVANSGVQPSAADSANDSGKADAPGSSYSIFSVSEQHLDNTRSLLEQIRRAGCKAGISINPNTPANLLEPLLGFFDVVLVMSVHPGFGGQKFIASIVEKIAFLSGIRAAHNSDFLIEVDGGINDQTCAAALAAGADILVAGNSVFAASDPVAALAELRKIASNVASTLPNQI